MTTPDATNTDYTSSLDFQTLRRLSRGAKQVDVACPLCGPTCNHPRNKTKKVLRIYNSSPNFSSYNCARCEAHGYARGFDGTAFYNPTTDPIPEATTTPKTDIARELWSRRQPIIGSPAETYLRQARHITCPLPATLAFLPSAGTYPPAMIAMFGDSVNVTGIHLTRLQPDGMGKAGTDADKIMLGPSMGQPIIVAGADDHLIVAEGIEDALTAHQVSGHGAWAAGSASRLPALADVVPSHIKTITVIVDDDDKGKTNATKLIRQLTSRGRFEIRVICGEQ